jgi:Fur family transcriptional regulator, ferric uptake regulator
VTVAHHSRPIVARSLAAAVTGLRARGLRISAARRLVLEALFAADGPVTAEAIAGGLEGRLPASDLASVYRNLDTLDTLGLVHHVHMGHGPGRYALAGRDEAAYVACEACGETVALAPAALAGVRHAVRAACGFDASFTHFPIVGRCPDCEEALHAHP